MGRQEGGLLVKRPWEAKARSLALAKRCREGEHREPGVGNGVELAPG